jgi:hypothetical protein
MSSSDAPSDWPAALEEAYRRAQGRLSAEQRERRAAFDTHTRRWARRLLAAGDDEQLLVHAVGYGAPDPTAWTATARDGAPLPVRVGLAPQPRFGAETTQTPSGWLVMVKEHTPALMNDYGWMVTAVLDGSLDAEGIRSLREELLRTERRLEPEADLRQLWDRRPGNAADASVRGAQALLFLVAHEVSHALWGHQGEPPRLELEWDVPARMHGSQEELHADTTAAHLCSCAGGDIGRAEVGARLFFGMTHLIDEEIARRAARRFTGVFAQRARDYLQSTHPHPMLRLAATRAGLGTPPPSEEAVAVQGAIDAIAGRPALVRDEAALTAFRDVLAGAEDGIVVETLGVLEGRRVGDVHAIDLGHLDALVRRDIDTALTVVAVAVLRYVQVNPARWTDMHTAVAMVDVDAAISRRWAADAAAERALHQMRAAIPEMDELLALTRHSQLTQGDSEQ